MERLTTRPQVALIKCSFCNKELDCYDSVECGIVDEALKRLKDYEDAEEQGLLLRLPCKVNDKIFAIIYDYEKDTEVIKESMIIEVTQNVNGWFFKSLIPAPAFRLHDFGKIVFLTREAVEAKLKEMEG